MVKTPFFMLEACQNYFKAILNIQMLFKSILKYLKALSTPSYMSFKTFLNPLHHRRRRAPPRSAGGSSGSSGSGSGGCAAVKASRATKGISSFAGWKPGG